jgi:cell division protein FtsZ
MEEIMKDQTIGGRFSYDSEALEQARIRVVGVGGGGGNAINNMVAKGIKGIEFIALNTDAQALNANTAQIRIQIGRNLTKGLGAGARPSIGGEAAEESRAEIEQALQGSDMVFITAGMGGGTGTGAAPVIAAIARRLGILTVAIVTKPFYCEGNRRLSTGSEGIKLLREHVDTLIVIPNERLLDVCEDDTTMIEAFKKADEVLYNATRGISDLITVNGLINLDFADVKTTMHNGGTALMGSATASGENRAEKAAVEAISSPLLDGLSIAGARNILVNITAGKTLGMREATTATDIINREAGPDAEVIFGTVIDENLEEELRVTVIATGFDQEGRNDDPSGRRRKQERTSTIDRTHETIRTPAIDLTTPLNYKGIENLKPLDNPAFQRRPLRPERVERATDSVRASGNIRKMPREDLNRKPERTLSDDAPPFLRKMMD